MISAKGEKLVEKSSTQGYIDWPEHLRLWGETECFSALWPRRSEVAKRLEAAARVNPDNETYTQYLAAIEFLT